MRRRQRLSAEFSRRHEMHRSSFNAAAATAVLALGLSSAVAPAMARGNHVGRGGGFHHGGFAGGGFHGGRGFASAGGFNRGFQHGGGWRQSYRGGRFPSRGYASGGYYGPGYYSPGYYGGYG